MTVVLRYLWLIVFSAALTCGQSAPWYLANQYPAAGATGVSTNINIQLTLASNFYNETFSLKSQAGTSVPLTSLFYYSSVALTPSTALSPSTQYTFTITPDPTVASPYSFSFTTGGGPDNTPPHLIGFSPASGTTGVGVNGPFTALFDKRISGPSVANSQGVQLTGQYLYGSSTTSIAADGMGVVVSIAPQSWPSFLQLTVDPTKFTDAFGNTGQGPPQTAHFSTFVVTDFSGPSLRTFFPADGDTAIPLNVSIRLLFDRPVDLKSASSLITLTSGGKPITVGYNAFAAGAGVALTLNNLLTPNQTYNVTIAPGLLDANELPAQQSGSFSFTTGSSPDGTAPTLLTVSPQQSTSLPLNGVLSFQTNKRIMPLAAVEFSGLNKTYPNGETIETDPATGALSPDGQTLIITPQSQLDPLQHYNVDLTDLVDVTGASFYGNVQYFFTGTAPDNTSPTLLAVSPADGSQNVPALAPIEILFNDAVGAPLAANPATLSTGGKNVAAQFIFNSSRTLLTVTPNIPLTSNATYSLSITGLANLAGAPFAASVTSFTTGSPAPSTQVQLLSASPAQGAQGVDVNSQIVLMYDTPLSPIAALQGFTISDATTVYPATAALSGSTLTITPSHPLLQNSLITVAVQTTDILGRRVYTNLTFTTGASQDTTPLLITGVSPADGGTIYGVTRTITLTFNKPIDAASLSSTTLTAYSNGALVTLSTMRANGDQSLVITPQFNQGGDLTLLATSGITDLAGNPLTPFRADLTFQPLNTSVSYARTAVAIRPPSGATGVPATTPVTWFFSTPTDLAKVNAALAVTANGAPVPGQFTLSSDGLILSFAPASPFPAGTVVRTFQRTQVFTDTYSASFTIASAPSQVTLTRYTPPATAPANSVIELEFSADVSPSQNLAGLYLPLNAYSTLPGTQLPATLSQPRPRVIRLTPKAPLTPGNYVVVLSQQVSNPLTLYEPDYIPFQATAPVTSSPIAPLTAPQAGSVGTPVNASISATFNVPVNPLAVIPDNISLQSGGVPIPFLTYLNQTGNGLLVTPTLPLPPDAEIDVAISGLEDRYGNPFAAASWSFVTGPSADFSPVTVLASSVPPQVYGSNSYPQLPATQPLVTVFSKPVDPRSVPTPLVIGSNPPTSFDVSWSPDFATLILTADPPLYNGRQISLYLPQITDLSGNPAQNFGQINFNVGFDPDTNSPNLLYASPADGQANLPLNAQIIASFDKNILPTSFGSVQLLLAGNPVPIVQESSDLNRLRFSPASPLQPNTAYTLSIAGVTDLSGNVMTNPVTQTFTTRANMDVTVPTLQVLATGALNIPIQVAFSEPVSPATVDSRSIVLSTANSNNTGGWNWVPVSAAVTLSSDGLTATVAPSAPLIPNWRYQVSVSGVRDFAGNAVANYNLPSPTFTTTSTPDTTPPVVVATPPDAAANVPSNTRIGATANKQMPPQPSSVLQLTSNGQRVPGTFSQIGGSFGFTPSAPLAPNTVYRLDVGSMTDLAGNVSAPVSSTFTTAGAGYAFPQFRLLSSSPANGDVGVDSNAPVVMTFSQPIDPATASYGIYFSTALPVPGTFAASGNTLTFTPSEPWPSAATVGVYLMGRFITLQSLIGQPLPYTSFSFTTVASPDLTPPQLLSAAPPAGATLTPPNPELFLTFSKTVSVGTNGLTYIAGSQSIPVTPSYETTDFHTLYFTPTVPANGQLTVAGTSAIVDRSGNSIAPFTLQFPTGASQSIGRPSVMTVTPSYGATGVAQTTPIVLQMSEAVDPATTQQSVRVTQNGQNITGQISLGNSNQTVRFTPDQPYPSGARIDVYVLETLADPSGLTSGTRYNSFFTAAGLNSNQVAQTSFGPTVAPDAALELAFDRPVPVTAVRTGNIWLRAGHRKISGAVSLRGTSIIRFVPDVPLQPGVEYALTVGPGLEIQPEEFHFRAEIPAAPTGVETAVVEKGAMHLRFTQPVSPLSVANVRLIRPDGTEVPAVRRIAPDFLDLWLIPRESGIDSAGLSLEGVEDRAGQPVRRKIR